MAEMVRFENHDGRDVFIDPDVPNIIRPGGGKGMTVIESWPLLGHQQGQQSPAPIIVMGDPAEVMAALGRPWRDSKQSPPHS